MKFVKSRWPNSRLSGDLQQFYQRRESLTIVNNCLVFGDRVVIPESLRLPILRQFHAGHPGIVRMKSLARSYVYWPNMDSHIETLVKNCSRCMIASKNPPRITPQPWPTPDKAWERVHIDFAGPMNGVMYMVVVDAYSKWPEIIPMTHASSTNTIEALRRIFCQHGFPETMVTDNGTQFTSAQFQEFCLLKGIQHVKSPPYHPQSNGQAERFVDTFKRALLKSRGEGTTEENLQTFLLAYRITPNAATKDGLSPSELLMGRRIRTSFDLLKPLKATHESSQHTMESGVFKQGERIYARDYRNGHHNWVEAIVVRRIGSVLYEVRVGRYTWTRHKNQIRRNFSQSAVLPETSETTLPLDLLLDTFQLNPEPMQAQEVSLVPTLRKSSRVRWPTTPIQVTPRHRSYR